jgi:hypothetical protein
MIALDAVKFVVEANGQAAAVQVDMRLWQQIVAALQDAEDIGLARAALAELESAGGDPKRAGWVLLKDAEATWDSDDEL